MSVRRGKYAITLDDAKDGEQKIVYVVGYSASMAVSRLMEKLNETQKERYSVNSTRLVTGG